MIFFFQFTYYVLILQCLLSVHLNLFGMPLLIPVLRNIKLHIFSNLSVLLQSNSWILKIQSNSSTMWGCSEKAPALNQKGLGGG